MDAKRYKFFTPTHLVFGEGCSGEVGQRVKALGGTRALLVSDKGSGTHGAGRQGEGRRWKPKGWWSSSTPTSAKTPRETTSTPAAT